jgi:hypothetical protein
MFKGTLGVTVIYVLNRKFRIKDRPAIGLAAIGIDEIDRLLGIFDASSIVTLFAHFDGLKAVGAADLDPAAIAENAALGEPLTMFCSNIMPIGLVVQIACRLLTAAHIVFGRGRVVISQFRLAGQGPDHF